MSTALLQKLPIKIFADGADLESIIDLYRKPFIQGLTTNPTLMRKVGIADYEAFCAFRSGKCHRQTNFIRSLLR